MEWDGFSLDLYDTIRHESRRTKKNFNTMEGTDTDTSVCDVSGLPTFRYQQLGAIFLLLFYLIYPLGCTIHLPT